MMGVSQSKNPAAPHRVFYLFLSDMCKHSLPLKDKSRPIGWLFVLVGVTGFEPAASSSRTKRATGLRYTPKNRLQN
jgi:hypothetical protein